MQWIPTSFSCVHCLSSALPSPATDRHSIIINGSVSPFCPGCPPIANPALLPLTVTCNRRVACLTPWLRRRSGEGWTPRIGPPRCVDRRNPISHRTRALSHVCIPHRDRCVRWQSIEHRHSIRAPTSMAHGTNRPCYRLESHSVSRRTTEPAALLSPPMASTVAFRTC